MPHETAEKLTKSLPSSDSDDAYLSPELNIASLLKAAGDPLRIDILRALAGDSLGVLELCHVFNIKQSGMSHHLKVLARADLVNTRREGNSIFYRRDSASSSQLQPLKRSLFETIDQLTLTPRQQNRLREIRDQRAAASVAFFNEHVDQFKQQQDLIANFNVYGSQVDDIIGAANLQAHQVALEVGPGEGEFLPFLAARFNQVIALDNAPAMLDKAKRLAQAEQLTNIEYVLGDTQYCASQLNRLNCAVLNMVLHHTPSPQQLFADISAALIAGGILVVCELCQHEQEWAKQACGDVWLGFEPNDLTLWAHEHQLIEKQNIVFALRNGFQVQIKQFEKLPQPLSTKRNKSC